MHLHDVFEEGVGFADQLNVAVLDSVMHHFDVMTGAIRSHVTAARFAIHLRRDLAKNGRDHFPRLARAARHDGRAFNLAFSAPRDPAPYKMTPPLTQFFAALLV